MNYSNNYTIENELVEYMKREKKSSILKAFRMIFFKNPQNLTNFQQYDIVGRILERNQFYFMDKIYPKLLKILKRALSISELREMERYILKNYSLYYGEDILTSFNGRIVQGDTQVKGHIYITRYRAIAHGKFGPTTIAAIGMAAAMSGGGGGGNSGAPGQYGSANQGAQGSNAALGVAIAYSIAESVKRKVQKAMVEQFDTNKNCYGYQYPLVDAYSIRRTNSNIKYRTEIEIQKRTKTKNKTLKMKIVPKEDVHNNLNIIREVLDVAHAF